MQISSFDDPVVAGIFLRCRKANLRCIQGLKRLLRDGTLFRMMDTWRKYDLSDVKMDGPPFSKIYIFICHLTSLLRQTRALDMQF
jgi:hypothetical protein